MKKTIEVSAEEMEVLNKLREQKAQKVKEEEERKSKEANRHALEAKFKASVGDARSKINEHLRIASEALDAAVQISEQTGVPFSTYVVNLGMSRTYQPRSFDKVWKDIPAQTLEDMNIYRGYESGWEYWSTSSMSC